MSQRRRKITQMASSTTLLCLLVLLLASFLFFSSATVTPFASKSRVEPLINSKTTTSINNAQPLNIFVVPHSHCDVGWLETIDGYYDTAVKQILDTAVAALMKDPSRRFIWVEMYAIVYAYLVVTNNLFLLTFKTEPSLASGGRQQQTPNALNSAIF